MIEDGVFKGVDYHEDVNNFFTNKIMSNNFVLHGIKQEGSDDYPYTIHCTNDYFYLEYTEKYQQLGYRNWGYTLVPKNTPVTYYELQEDGSYLEKTQTLDYTACYGFKQREDGSLFFDFFKGPLEDSGLDYIELDELPEEGEEGVIYIINENGTKVSYEWVQSTNGYEFLLYDNWFNSVGEFAINANYATFYLSGTALASIGSVYFEKSLDEDDLYFSKDSTIIGALAKTLFGWGFQATDTWMDYIKNSKIRINKDENNEIISYDIGLDVMGKLNGSETGLHEISYTIDSFGKGNVQFVEEFLNSTLGGGLYE